MSEIYFAQIREDSLVERMAVAGRNIKNIMCVGSGGCTALSLLNNDVQKIYCVDNNPAQCALIELKKAAIKTLDRPAFIAFIGETESLERMKIFQSFAHLLPEYAQAFWSGNLKFIENGINQCGATERFYAFVSAAILNNVYEEKIWQELFNCKTIKEQKVVYDRYFAAEKWITAIKILLSKDMHLQFFPAFMFAHAVIDDFSNFFLKQFKKEINNKLVRDNYFLSQFIFQKYIPDEKEGMPFYLTKQGYEQAKQNIHKLEIINAGVQEVCEQAKNIDCFLLSNVFDWCTGEQRSGICKAIEQCKSASSFLLYRNMFATVNITGYFEHPVKEGLNFSTLLYHTERSMMYNNISFLEL